MPGQLRQLRLQVVGGSGGRQGPRRQVSALHVQVRVFESISLLRLAFPNLMQPRLTSLSGAMFTNPYGHRQS